ncbi:MAG: hypothetical protein A4E20_12165 [Nitrospira sp. SG-bin2]|uniref:hypothetical protein n=1 Tax=Nitrospira cf. moscoviensis SBR1015 TaxID=96242 RepID=UPI000A0C71BB|nr:hypothetical protein [Nitrospira cf. moscoviensis SBR1015]OQW33976.1 MAG: hypothetical protein A4E20_12165 [Nitrospira sp. SG-bin2]
MAFVGFNNRSTLGFVTDPAGSSFLAPAAYAPPAGYTSTLPTANDNNNTTFDPRIAGWHTFSSGNNRLKVDVPQPGSYKLRLAFGSSAAARQACFVFDGDDPGTFTIWAASTTYTADVSRVFVNGNIYICRQTGASAASGGPTGTGTGIVDGATRWDYVSTPILVVDSVTNVAANSIYSANGETVAGTAWPTGTTEPTVNITKGFFTIVRRPSLTSNLRHVAYELQITPLAAATLTNDVNDPLTELYCNQPIGKKIARIAVASGANAFTLGGTLASYYAIQQFGSQYWIVAAARMPDSVVAGGGSLIVIQTDASAPGSPYSTTFTTSGGTPNLTLVSSQGRDVNTSLLGLCSTEAWLHYKTEFDYLTANEWPGYTNQPFVSDVTVNSSASLASAISAITPNGTGWYRIRLQNGTYSTGNTVLANKDFGTGGLLIEPDSGHDPEISGGFTLHMNSLHIRGLKLTGVTATSYILTMAVVLDGVFNRVRVTGNRIGGMFKTGAGPAPAESGNFKSFALCASASQFISRDNIYNGLVTCNNVFSTGLFVDIGNDYQNVLDDTNAVSVAQYNNAPTAAMPANKMRVVSDKATQRNAVDYYNTLVGQGPHRDYFQFRTLLGSLGIVKGYSYGRSFTAGDYCYNSFNNNIYLCTTGGTSAGSGSGPTGTGTGIVDGTAIFSFHEAYNFQGFELSVVFVNAVILSDGVTYNDSGGYRYTTQIDCILDSSASVPQKLTLTTMNVICASRAAYGVSVAQSAAGSVANVEFCTFAGAAQNPLSGGLGMRNDAWIRGYETGLGYGGSTRIRARNNVLALAPSSQSNNLADEGNVIVKFGSGTVAPDRPTDRLNGPFQTNADGLWEYPGVQDDGLNTQSAFRQQMFSYLKMPSLAAGAQTAGGESTNPIPRSSSFALNFGLSLELS